MMLYDTSYSDRTCMRPGSPTGITNDHEAHCHDNPHPRPAAVAAAAQTPVPKPGEVAQWQDLFNGKDLTGWVNINTAEDTWKVRDGMLI